MRKNMTWNAVRSLMLLSLVLSALVIAACSDNGSDPPPVSNEYTAFGNPELVTITGYTGDAMEPFISRTSGTAYLFFNDTLNGKDLYCATFSNVTTVQTPTPISSINSPAVDGVPTMDDGNDFYYVSLASYTTNSVTLYAGTWNGTTVTGSTPLSNLTLPSPFLYFDIEVSPDGSTLYLSIGAFTGGDFPSAADIAIATGSGSSFAPLSNWEDIMANVNTTDKLEYAPAISRNGLELFFTRFDPHTGQARIYRSVRSDTGSPFGKAQLVSAITGFVEGPALSPDEKSLYYHRLNTGSNKYEIYRVTRL